MRIPYYPGDAGKLGYFFGGTLSVAPGDNYTRNGREVAQNGTVPPESQEGDGRASVAIRFGDGRLNDDASR